MTKLKVGDKVRITSKEGNCAVGAVVGSIAEILSDYDGEHYRVLYDSGDGVANTRGWIAPFNLELVSDKPTKNQRLTDAERTITTLESEVAELKAKVEALEKAQSPAKTITVIADAIARYNAKQPTPNEQRKAVIAEAKAFVAIVEAQLGCAHADRTQGNYTYQETSGYAKYNVNAEKRTVVALVHSKYTDKVIEKAIAKCAPDDVFNADIGKAIALGRALGLDVSRFEQAVKPTEVVVGMVVRTKYEYGGYNDDCPTKVTGVTAKGYPEFKNGTHSSMYEIKDDADAQY